MKSGYLIFLLSCLMLIAKPLMAATSIDELVEQVKKESLLQKKEDIEREQEFKDAHDKQSQMLSEAKALLEAEQKRSDALKAIYEQNEREINQQDVELKKKMGSLSEMHGIVRQIANDMDSIIDNSLVSAQIPHRDKIIDKLANSKILPDIKELENLWQVALQEMAETGKVVTFPAKIITNDGKELMQNVTRVGAFDLVSNGHFLRFLPESDHLIEPGRQPASRYQTMASELEQNKSGYVPFPIDPTRGSLLALLIQLPDLKTRISQGGPVGMIIIIIAIIALIIGVFRFYKLTIIENNVKSQMQNETPGDNPLGRIISVYKQNPDVDTETLGLKLDEAILKEMPVIQKGLRPISLFAEIALLLGLLGTVTGIIQTFQAITLYGTGDPRIMSGGISQALITTVMGLVTSIPLLLLHSFLTAKSNRLIHILDEKSAAYVAMLAESKHGSNV